MNVSTQQGTIQDYPADTLVVNLFEGTSSPTGATGAVDKALGGMISDLITSGDMRGKEGEVTVLYPRGAISAKRVLITGMGKPEKFNLDSVRKAAAAAIKRARDLRANRVATIVHGAGFGRLPVAAAAQATVE